MQQRSSKRTSDPKSSSYILYAWGVSHFEPTEIQRNVVQVAAGENHSLFVTNIGECFGLGSNRFGQLGIENMPSCSTPVQTFTEIGKITLIDCGAEHTVILTGKGQVFATGLNIKGQLGLGNFDNIGKPRLIPSLLPHGQKNPKASNKDIMKKMKLPIYNIIEKFEVQVKYEDEDLEIHQTLLGSDQSIEQISCGALHTLVLSNKGRVYGCGFQNVSNNTDDYLDRSGFRNVSFDKAIKYISSGLSGSAAGAADGSVYVWGKFGKVAHNIPTILKSSLDNIRQDIFVDARVGDGFIMLLNSRGDVYTMGENLHGQLGSQELFQDKPARVIKAPTFRSISAGRSYCLAVGTDDQLYGWGCNKNGQLMLGSRSLTVLKTCTQLGIAVKPSQKILASSFCSYILRKEAWEQRKQKQEVVEEQMEVKEYKKLLHEYHLLKNLNLSLIQKTTKPVLIEQSSQTVSKFQVQGVSKFRTFDNNLEIAWGQLQIQKLISEGGYGLIYKAKWRETIVAVKKFKIENGDAGLRDFLSQCHAMQAVRHPNIVMFLGVCTKSPNYSIVLEYCSKGSLWSILQDQQVKLPWEDRKRIAIEIARAVLYLHMCNPPIIHRDLKSLNILLDENYHVKIADFGWTKMLAEYMSSKIGTYQWMAPEVIGSSNYSEKADVFSYAIILWQIASRQPPYKNIKGQEVSQQVLANELRPTIPKTTPEGFAKLMKQCWETTPERRPGFKEIIKQLQTMKLPS